MNKSTSAGVPLILERTITIRWPLSRNLLIRYDWKRETQALANKTANMKAEGRYPSVSTEGSSR